MSNNTYPTTIPAMHRYRLDDERVARVFAAASRHGAAPNRLMVHLAINEGDAEHDVVHWLDAVRDEEYGAVAVPD